MVRGCWYWLSAGIFLFGCEEPECGKSLTCDFGPLDARPPDDAVAHDAGAKATDGKDSAGVEVETAAGGSGASSASKGSGAEAGAGITGAETGGVEGQNDGAGGASSSAGAQSDPTSMPDARGGQSGVQDAGDEDTPSGGSEERIADGGAPDDVSDDKPRSCGSCESWQYCNVATGLCACVPAVYDAPDSTFDHTCFQ